MERFSLRMPLILAPLAGGPSTPELAAAVSEAGGLGSLGCAYLKPEQIEGEVRQLRRFSAKPFAVNLFVPAMEPALSASRIDNALSATRGYRRELGLPDPVVRPPFAEDFEAQFETVLRLRPAVLSFVFGVLTREQVAACRSAGIALIGTATSLDEARRLEADVDAITLQGLEAGGHRGIFDDEADDPGVRCLDLVRACAREIRVPLIAAGGLMTGAHIKAALDAGAETAQLGTAFLLCPEAGTSKPYRHALSTARKPTRLTRAFSGRLARGIENRFLLEMENHPEAILPFPAQNAFTRDLRRASTEQGKPDFLSLWAGTGVDDLRAMPAAELVECLRRELEA